MDTPKKSMKIAIYGTGYVGLVTGVTFAELGHQVLCVDIDQSKVDTLRSGQVPFYEPGVDQLLSKHSISGRLTFSTDPEAGADFSNVAFLAVGTPQAKDGTANLEYLFGAAKTLAEKWTNKGSKLLVTKSTVPIGTGEKMRKFLDQNGFPNIQVASNPEFLREGCALNDALEPERIVYGAEGPEGLEILREIYAPQVEKGVACLEMDVVSAELVKYSANAYLAMRLAFVNEMARICDHTGAKVVSVLKAVGADSRIGAHYFNPGPGYGGSCFPKDTHALAAWARTQKKTLGLVEATILANENHQREIAEQIYQVAVGKKGTVAFMGLAFKNDTDDIRESPALHLGKYLLAKDIKVVFTDPQALGQGRKHPDLEAALFVDDPYEALKGAAIVVIATEWNLYRNLDLKRVALEAPGATIFDLRYLLDPTAVKGQGLVYKALGVS